MSRACCVQGKGVAAGYALVAEHAPSSPNANFADVGPAGLVRGEAGGRNMENTIFLQMKGQLLVVDASSVLGLVLMHEDVHFCKRRSMILLVIILPTRIPNTRPIRRLPTALDFDPAHAVA